MFDGIPLEAVGIGSGWLFVGLFVIAMLRGRLVPRSTLEDARTTFDAVRADLAHDRDEWRAAHRISETARVMGEENQRALLEPTAHTVNQLMREMQERLRPGVGRIQSGGDRTEEIP